MKRRIKEEVIARLRGDRFSLMWDLIKRVTNTKEKDIPKNVKQNYKIIEDEINNLRYRYFIFEQYNFPEGLYYRFYEDNISLNNQNIFELMFEDYFSDVNNSWNEIVIIDMNEMKAYLVDKQVSYTQKELK